MIHYSSNKQSGYLLVVVLVFAGVFMTILTSFVSFIVIQSRLIDQRVQFEQAGQIAEAGLNYYKWYLAHYPNATSTSVTGVYSDSEGGPIGQYQVSVASTTYCGSVSSLQVTSVGYTYENPMVRRTMAARYAKPNVAEFSFILNSSVWAGDDRVINGPYHSNGGVRMDAVHNSSVTSGQSTWSCTSSFGCSPSQTVGGVYTTSGNATPSLFDYPSPPVNFAGITVDLATIKNRAQTGGGLYIGSSGNGNDGWHLVFNSNNTVTVRRVNDTFEYWGYTTENDWEEERHIMTNTSAYNTYTIPASCPVIFVEDKVWIEGAVSRKVTLAAANVTSTSINPSVILQGNITYTSATTSGLLAIAEQDVLIGVNVPDNMVLNGIFIAQNGRYGRNHYVDSGSYDIGNTYDEYVIRNSETHNGTIVSNGRVGTQWVNGSGVTLSGFRNRYTSYDRNLVESPPPFIPNTSEVYEFSDWRDAN